MPEDLGATLEKLIVKRNLCYLGSVDQEGFPETRAMLSPRARQGLKEFYLTTNTSSPKVKNFRTNSKACLYFMDPEFYRGLLFKGTIEVLEDQSSKDLIWQNSDFIFYADGKTDSDYCVLKFTAQKATFYHDFKSDHFEIN